MSYNLQTHPVILNPQQCQQCHRQIQISQIQVPQNSTQIQTKIANTSSVESNNVVI